MAKTENTKTASQRCLHQSSRTTNLEIRRLNVKHDIQRTRNRGGGGGHLGQVPHHFLYLGKKCPFSGIKVPYFHGIEVPFLQNLSALFGQCLLTFEVLPLPLMIFSVLCEVENYTGDTR